MARRKAQHDSDIQRADKLKRLTVVALVSDDDLLDRLVLKGGNAMGLTGEVSVRQSIDVDFSIDGDIAELGSLEEIRELMERLLVETFREEGYEVFDVTLERQPPNLQDDVLGGFWGGYKLAFKVLDAATFKLLDLEETRRRQAIVVAPGVRRTFTVDLSKHECCGEKVLRRVGNHNVYVYSERMLVCEKIRAICQQMPEYREIVKSQSAKPRARDFFDIHHMITNYDVDVSTDEFWYTLIGMFRAKKVPLSLLGRISKHREFHRDDFGSVRDTVAVSIKLREFDFYVNFLVERLALLEARWEVEPPSL